MNKQPLISGFTFIKNGLTLGYPIKESIESIAPICDEIVINVGYDDPNLENDDGTYEYLTSSFKHPKFKFVKSYWDPEVSSQGLILSQQTNIALSHCTGKYCQYIQGDEVIHEDDLPKIQDAAMLLEKNDHIDGIIFKYLHFYGNVDIIKFTRNIYRREVRLIRNQKGIKSWLDAQGFRNSDNTKVKCAEIDATILHYGWARKEQVMSKKVFEMDKLYHGQENVANKFTYRRIWGLKPFTKSHPRVMTQWINSHRNDLDIMSLPLDFKFKDIGLVISDFIESITNFRVGEYKNFKIVKIKHN